MCGGGESWGNDRGGVECVEGWWIGRVSGAGDGGGDSASEGFGEGRVEEKKGLRGSGGAKVEKRGK